MRSRSRRPWVVASWLLALGSLALAVAGAPPYAPTPTTAGNDVRPRQLLKRQDAATPPPPGPAEQIIIVDQNGNPVETKFADDPTVPTSTVVVTVPGSKKAAGGLSPTIIAVISGVGGLAVILLLIGCCIAKRRKGDKNDWLTALLAHDATEPSSPHPPSAKAQEHSPPPAPMPAPAPQPLQHMPMMSMNPFGFPMFGMPQMAAAPPPYVAPAPAPPPPQAAPSAIARSFYSGSMRRSPTMPHHPGLPSIEPHVYDDGRPATVDGRLESEKARWFKKARNGINPSAVAPSLLEPNAAPTIGHSVWEGEPDGRSEDGLTSVSRRGREPPKPKKSIPETRRSGSRGGLSRGIAKAASLSKPERHRSRMAGAPAFNDYSGARSGGTRRYARPVTLSESDIAGGSAPASAVSSNYERATRSRGNAPATAFSLSESDLGGASAQSLSWRGASNDGSGMRTLAGSTLVSGLKPRHRRIDSLVRSEAQSRRTRG